jgi:hypothetical protein
MPALDPLTVGGCVFPRIETLSPKPVAGKAAIVASEQALFDAFSEIEVEVLGVIAQGDDIALEVVLRATNTGPLDVGAESRYCRPAAESSFRRCGSCGSTPMGRSRRSATTSTRPASSASSA